MRPLMLHPGSRCPAIARIEVAAVRRRGALLLRYVVIPTGADTDLSIRIARWKSLKRRAGLPAGTASDDESNPMPAGITGVIGDLRLPAKATPERTDGLWRHTCFEAFVKPQPGEGYCEFNFAPSRAWAAYRFDAYRSGLRAADISPPHIDMHEGEGRFEISVRLETGALDAVPWRLGLSAVIEDENGNLSYWALAHPPGKADFHHPDCFAFRLAAPSPP